jgi:hypothetical protein
MVRVRTGKLWCCLCRVHRASQASRYLHARRKAFGAGFESLVDARFNEARIFSADFAQFHP